MPGWYAVREKDLPVELPMVKDFRPRGTGVSPLASVKSFYETTCLVCGSKARRETDVSDTFLDSAWYYIGYLAKTPTSTSRILNPILNPLNKKWLPVHMYIGGAEHAVLHLLYIRFLAKALNDWGYVHFREPVEKFRAHGLLIREGRKISKSRGNIINPDEFIKKFGADALRLHLMFLGPFEEGGDFRDRGILGPVRFLDRVWRLANCLLNRKGQNFIPLIQKTNRHLRHSGAFTVSDRILHQAVKKVTDDIENLHYNTAVSTLMTLLNEMEKASSLPKDHFEIFLKLLAPFAPHLAEEIWRAILGNKSSIHISPWPKYEPKFVKAESFILLIQINGRVRDSVEVEAGLSESEAENLALQREKIRAFLGGRSPKRVIYLPGRLINIVV